MNLATNINFFLGLQVQLKINHWQTKGLGRHQSFGFAYDELQDLTDTFVEEAMGKYGRFVLEEENKTIQLSNLSELNIKSFVDTVRDALVQFTDQLDATDTNLLNIRDEMLGVVNKMSYLLTLE
jgi:DNA-binding ferritin-like protein